MTVTPVTNGLTVITLRRLLVPQMSFLRVRLFSIYSLTHIPDLKIESKLQCNIQSNRKLETNTLTNKKF